MSSLKHSIIFLILYLLNLLYFMPFTLNLFQDDGLEPKNNSELHDPPNGVFLSALAHGIPMGGELDHLDDGTLFTAFSARK